MKNRIIRLVNLVYTVTKNNLQNILWTVIQAFMDDWSRLLAEIPDQSFSLNYFSKTLLPVDLYKRCFALSRWPEPETKKLKRWRNVVKPTAQFFFNLLHFIVSGSDCTSWQSLQPHSLSLAYPRFLDTMSLFLTGQPWTSASFSARKILRAPRLVLW